MHDREGEVMLSQLSIHTIVFILSALLPAVHPASEIKQQLGEITIEGASAFSQRELFDIARIKPKQNIKPQTLESIEPQIKNSYLERGFIKVKVSVSQEISAQQGSGSTEIINLKITIDEGPRFFIRRTEVMGNATTNHMVIMRAAGLWPDRPYNPNRIDKWIEGLNRLGRFEPVKRESIKVEVNEQEHFVDVLFQLQEKPGLKIRRH